MRAQDYYRRQAPNQSVLTAHDNIFWVTGSQERRPKEDEVDGNHSSPFVGFFLRSRVGVRGMERNAGKSHRVRPISLYTIFPFCNFHFRIDGELEVSASTGVSGGLLSTTGIVTHGRWF